MEDMGQEFEKAVADAIRQCHEFDYYPIVWERMNRDYGPVEAAIKLVQSGEIQSGFRHLEREGRLELSVESLMLEDRFDGLFSPMVLAAPKWRLEQATKKTDCDPYAIC
ncbi:hypothetical protein PSCICO_31940 [Pseudomonas cichorii]|uniref:hypothetical protein n=1 Tax=Pseudomonas cichorii TaxID=36746 RepID=UPI0019103D28|nr:hypothetical protein [Pseudomonas cichorii]GFM87795.1 hypothetical protein PSCICO_31940 [Pseudomonas cichorii]